jgi:hypothetical protein
VTPANERSRFHVFTTEQKELVKQKPAISTTGKGVGRKSQCEPLGEVIMAKADSARSVFTRIWYQKLRIRPSDGRSQRRDDPDATRAFLDSLWANRRILIPFSSIQFLARPNRQRHVEEFHQLNLATARRAFLARARGPASRPRVPSAPPPDLADN